LVPVRICVYRASAVKSLEKVSWSWRLVFSRSSYAGAVAAVRARMGISLMPQTMIPDDLQAIDASLLPKLADTHISLIKHIANNAAINTLEEFVLRRFKH